MIRPPDILIRVIFELQFRDKKRVTQIQDRISSFSARPLPTLVEDSLAWLSRDRVLVFEHVELDIGEVRLSRLEDDLAAGIARCLRRWAFTAQPSSSRRLLAYSQETTRDKAHQAEVHGSTQSQQVLTHPKSQPRGLNAAIAAALEQRGDWPEFLYVLRDNHALRRRIADEVSPRLLRRLLAELMQEQGTSIAGFAETMIQLHERQPLVPATLHAFRRELWECIFAELAASSRNQITERSFIVNVVKRLTGLTAAHRGFAAALSQALRRQPPGTAVVELFSDAISELNAGNSAMPVHLSAAMSPTDACVSGISRRVSTLEMFFETGVLGWSLIGSTPERELVQLLDADPGELWPVLRSLCEKETVRGRIASHLSEAAKSRLLNALAPTVSSWMLAFMHEICRVHAQKRLVEATSRQMASELWEFCFEYLSQSEKHSLEPRSFLKHLLGRLAERNRTGYHSLLCDLALRRGPELRTGITRKAQAVSFEQVLLPLLDQTLFGISDAGIKPSSLLIDPGFHPCYSDLDVLAHWLRWHKLPTWSSATDPEQTGRQLGSLLYELPREIQVYADRAPGHGKSEVIRPGGTSAQVPPAEQIRHWLAYGIWPDSILAPDASQLSAWLEHQSDADWLKALEGDSANEAIVARLSHQASPGLFERVVRLLAGHAAGLVTEYIRILDTGGRHIAPVASQVWADQVKKYALLYLLRTSSISGRHAISILDLARSTMIALSLNCRLPYARLLDHVELESHEQKEVNNVARLLRQELDRETPLDSKTEVASKDTIAASDGHDLSAPVITPELELRPPVVGNRGHEDVHLLRFKSNAPRVTASAPPRVQTQAGESKVLEFTDRASSQPPRSSSEDDRKTTIAALADFLRTGRLSTSSETLVGTSSSKWITACLSNSPQLTMQMLQSVAAHAGVLPRLMRYVEPAELQQIVHAAAPGYGGLLLLYIDAGAQSVAAGAVSTSPPPRSRRAAIHWEQTLAFLLDKDSARHSAAAALRELTVRVSRKLAIRHDQYISELQSIARARKTQNLGYPALAEMLEQMQPPAPADTPAVPSHAGDEEEARVHCERPQQIPQQNSEFETVKPLPTSPAPAACSQSKTAAESTLSFAHDDTTDLDELAVGSPAPNDNLAQLDYLLRYGALADHAPMADCEQLMTRIEGELGQRSRAYRAYILKGAGRELERKRMARFLAPRVLALVWPLLLPAQHANAAFCIELLEEAAQIGSLGRSGSICRELVIAEVFNSISNSQGRRWDGAIFLRSAVERLASHLSVREAVFVKHIRTVLEQKPASARAQVQAIIDRIELELAVIPPLRPALNSHADEHRARPLHPTKPARSLSEGEPFYISNAGLVLLWPFVQTYFQKLGLLDKNAFSDRQAHARAIYLLQYLASGKWEAPEQDLLLNKILTGWPIEQPPDFPAPLGENEAALSLDLLRGVLKNWEKLKGTSVEGLRSSFLMREGNLMLKEGDWYLAVSPKAYDMLLDSLPWRLGMIKLPWMKTLLRVKWR